MRSNLRTSLWYALDLGGYDHPTVEDAGLTDAALLGHSRRQLLAR